jgi:hypothetical protein
MRVRLPLKEQQHGRDTCDLDKALIPTVLTSLSIGRVLTPAR